MKKFLLLVFPSFLLFACTAFNSPAQSQIANETLTIFSVAKTIARKATVSSHEDRILIDNCAVGCPIGESGKTITRKTYTLNNNSQTKFANWVAYKITKNSLGSNCARTWRIDPLLNPNDTLAPKDYIGANRELQVDRGHQAPLASLCGLEGHDSLNYLSNITPQKSALNQGPWERLEDQERKLIRRDDVTAVYSVTGTLYEKFIGKLPNAMKEHAIPSGYWKVIFINDSPAVNHYAAFVFQQEASNSADFCTYQTTVSEIEARTGLNIWSSLSTKIQTYIKSTPGLLPRLMGCTLTKQVQQVQ
jgi:endonuclease G